MIKENKEGKVISAAREVVRIERNCFYGQEQERDRLKKMRELIDKVAKELADDN